MMIWSDYGTKEIGKSLYQKFIWEVAFGEPDSTNQVAFENPNFLKNLFKTAQSGRSNKIKVGALFSVEMTVQFDSICIPGQVIYSDRPLWLQYGSLPSILQVFFQTVRKVIRFWYHACTKMLQ